MSTNVKRKTAAKTPPASMFRPDIQGLRAVAVIVVILDHLFGWPSGGFVGVDVFFVISGFLITGLMLREHEKTGRISWIVFYKRRVRRIVPAATACLLVVVVASDLIYRTARFDAVKMDAIWSFLFVSNWHYAEQGTDYLQANGPVSPLQHFWSLSVEEQFYIVWPALLIVVLGLIGRRLRVRGRSVARLLVVAVAAVAAASFVWAMVETTNSPTWAYFSTFSRGWELAVGALLAVGAAKLARIPVRLRPVLSLSGLAVIAASLFLITSTTPFPGPWAALPVLGATLILAAGIGGTPRFTQALTNPVSVYIGKISYSLYLWHFPVIILLAAVIPADTFAYLLIAIAGMAVLAVASFHLVEAPVRRSKWLDPAAHGGRTNLARRAGVYALGLFAALVAILVAYSLQVSAVVDSVAISKALNSDPVTTLTEQAAAPDAQSVLTTSIFAALGVTQWPAMSPSLDTLGRDSLASEWVKDGCLGKDGAQVNDPQVNTEHCTYGDPNAARTAILLGDSIAISYLPGLRAALEPNGYKIRVLTLQECPFAALPVTHGAEAGRVHELCDGFRQWALDQVAAIHPDLVVTSTSMTTLGRIVGDPAEADALAQWKPALESSLTELVGHAGKVVELAPPPGAPNLTVCATQLSVPADCIGTPDAAYGMVSTIDGAAIAAMGDGFSYVPTRQWFCTPEGRCPTFIGTTPVFADGGHMTDAYSRSLGPLLWDALKG